MSEMKPHGLEFTTLGDVEAWVGTEWIYTPGSDEAQLHMRAKLREETCELREALGEDDPDAICTELGDVLWTSCATAMNEGFSLEEAFWYSSVAELLPEGQRLTLAYIDSLACSAWIDWDAPAVRALRNMSSEEMSHRMQRGDNELTQQVLGELSHELGRSTRKLHVLENSIWTRLDGARANEALVQLVILSGYIAQTRLNSTLADVMEANRAKLTARLQAGRQITRRPRTL